MAWGIDIGCTSRICPVVPIWFFLPEAKYYSYMDVFGIGIRAVDMRLFLRAG
jgi:hypothetical protein